MSSLRSEPPKVAMTRSCWWSVRPGSTAATARSTVFSCDILESRPGYISLEIEEAGSFFDNEPGGHRWQRIPPNEKRGRVHTSTVTVAVLPLAGSPEEIDESDLTWTATRGSGKGGQARNKVSNAVTMVHVPTGTRVRVESDRSQWRNRRAAAALIRERVMAAAGDGGRGDLRRAQVGSGERGDKRRTIRVRDDRVHDHITGAKTSLRRYEGGHLEDLR